MFEMTAFGAVKPFGGTTPNGRFPTNADLGILRFKVRSAAEGYIRHRQKCSFRNA